MCLVQRTVFACMTSHPTHLYLHGTVPPIQPCNNTPPDTMHCNNAFFVDKRVQGVCGNCAEYPDFIERLDQRVPRGEVPKESSRELLRGMCD